MFVFSAINLVCMSKKQRKYILFHLAVVKALSKEQDLGDQSRVWNHHGDGSEHGLEVVRELSATSIPLGHSQNNNTRMD